MPITDILPMIQSHAWVPLAALVIGFLVRALKSDAFVLPSWAAVAAPYRPLLVLALGIVSGVLNAVVAGTPWRDALIGGCLSALMALIGHTTIVDVLRGGRDIGAPAPPAEKGPLYQPPAPPSSDEVTLPKGPSVQRCSAHYVGGALPLQGSTCDLPAGHAGQHQQKDRRWDATASSRPRGVARLDAVLAVCGALVILVLAQIVFGCAWLKSNGPEVIHVVDEIDHVCPAVALTLPEIGPICVALDQAERILEILRLAARDKAAAHLRIGGRDLTVRADDVGAVLAGVEGPVAAARGGR